MHWFAVAIGGALGAMARYAVSTLVFDATSYRFPYATLSVNVLGSFIMGVLFVVILEKGLLPPEMRSILMIGFLGAFTTYSAFSLDTLSLLQQGNYNDAFLLAAATLSLCLLATFCGYQLTKSFF